MSRNLTRLDRQFDVPVVAMPELNRGPERRTDEKPAFQGRSGRFFDLGPA